MIHLSRLLTTAGEITRNVFINSRNNCAYPPVLLRYLFLSFSNIMAVLSLDRDEMTALHLIKSYCLSALLYTLAFPEGSSGVYSPLNLRSFLCFHKNTVQTLLLT